MLALLKTYIDIIALRKGPDAIPASWLVLVLSLAMLALAWLLQVSMIEGLAEQRLWPALVGYVLALAFYAGIIYVFGFPARLLQSISVIIACGSIVAIASVAGYVLLAPVLGLQTATAIGTLIWFWSIPVKGHVVACTISQHWFVGITIAIAAFIMRFGVESAFAVQS